MIRLICGYQLRDYRGRPIGSEEWEARSLLLNFAKILCAGFRAPGGESTGYSGLVTSATVLDWDGTERTAPGLWYAGDHYYGGGVMMAMNASSGDDSYGILVGSGSTPVSYNDYRLASKITHGTGAGQLSYGPHSTAISLGGSSSFVEISRTFVNVSGSTVTVREMGLVAWNYWKDGIAVRYNVKFLIARDLLPAPVTVPNFASLVARYKFSLTL